MGSLGKCEATIADEIAGLVQALSGDYPHML
jgi:hypothetical protein